MPNGLRIIEAGPIEILRGLVGVEIWCVVCRKNID